MNETNKNLSQNLINKLAVLASASVFPISTAASVVRLAYYWIGSMGIGLHNFSGGAFKRFRWLAVLVLTPAMFWISIGHCRADDADAELKKPSSWKPPTVDRITDGFKTWLTSQDADLDQVTASVDVLSEGLSGVTRSQRIDVIVDAIAGVRPDIDTFVRQLRQKESSSGDRMVLDFQYDIDDPIENDFVSRHLRLFYGRWLAQHQLYDESLAQLNRIEVDAVLVPATLLYYRGLMQHQLLMKEQCLQTAKKLLENEDDLPRRYAAIGKLMIADLEPLEVDSLDEISRLMNDVGRRTSLSRAGDRVISKEKTVIEKLDKLIESLEQQQQKSNAKSNSRSSKAPSGPIKASQVAGGGATGEAARKRQQDGGDWGDLPPAQRAAAMAEMSKEMPPHYRAVIEEYFRRLARE